MTNDGFNPDNLTGFRRLTYLLAWSEQVAPAPILGFGPQEA